VDGKVKMVYAVLCVTAEYIFLSQASSPTGGVEELMGPLQGMMFSVENCQQMVYVELHI
jgi:hypothetical protein